MSELFYNREGHILYTLGTSFEQKMEDVYIGLSTLKKPPFFSGIVSESTQMQALLAMDREKERGFPNLPKEMWEEWDEQIWQNNGYAIAHVFENLPINAYTDTIKDIARYLRINKLSFIFSNEQSSDLGNLTIYQEPVKSVW